MQAYRRTIVRSSRLESVPNCFSVSAKVGVSPGLRTFGERLGKALPWGCDHPALLGELSWWRSRTEEELDGSLDWDFRFILAFVLPLPWILRFVGYGSAAGSPSVALRHCRAVSCQDEMLFPAFQFVAGELGFFLVLAKFELQVNVGHGFSL